MREGRILRKDAMSIKSRLARTIAPVIGFCALAACSAAPEPQPVTDLRTLAADEMAGRLVGTPGNARARAYITQRYAEIGLEPVGGSFAHPFDFTRPTDFRDPGSAPVEMRGVNLIGMVEGSGAGDDVIVVTAHFDHLGPAEAGEIFNGADDNASGVAALLAAAEAVSRRAPENDVMFVAFDAEEGGLNGARAFMEDPPIDADRIAFNLNLDMVGYSPDGDLWAVGTYHYPVLEPIVARIAENAAVELKMGFDRPTENRRNDWTLLSDHAPFHLAGVPFLYLGVEDHAHYHQPSDEFAVIPLDFFLGAVETATMTLRAVDAELDAITAAPSRIEADAGG